MFNIGLSKGLAQLGTLVGATLPVRVVQCVAVCCSVLQFVAVCTLGNTLQHTATHFRFVLQFVAVCCRVLPFVAVCCSVLQCVVVCCSVLQCVAVCCSVLPWLATLPVRESCHIYESVMPHV